MSKQDDAVTKNPYEELGLTGPAAEMAVVSKALTAYSNISKKKPDHERAVALLRKVLGDDVRYVEVLSDEDDYEPEFLVDGILLIFIQGATPEDDSFLIEFVEVAPDTVVRTFEGLGEALAEALELAAETIQVGRMREMRAHRCPIDLLVEEFIRQTGKASVEQEKTE
jgi:hypothetical protein